MATATDTEEYGLTVEVPDRPGELRFAQVMGSVPEPPEVANPRHGLAPRGAQAAVCPHHHLRHRLVAGDRGQPVLGGEPGAHLDHVGHRQDRLGRTDQPGPGGRRRRATSRSAASYSRG